MYNILSFIWAVKQLWCHLIVLPTTSGMSAGVAEAGTVARPIRAARQPPAQHTYLAWRLTVITKAVPLGRGRSIALRSG